MKLIKSISLIILVGIFFIMTVSLNPVLGQTMEQIGPSLTITDLDTRDFPTIRVSVKADHLIGTEESFITLDNLTIIEDEIEFKAQEINENYLGVHFALAINPNVDLDYRDSKGVSHYSKLVDGFKQITDALQQRTGNEYSLFINPDVEYTQLSEFDSFKTALENYQENFRGQRASLESLQKALDTLDGDETGLEKCLLFITPLPLLEDLKELEQIASHIDEHNSILHIWAVGTANILDYPQGKVLEKMAKATGGTFFSFTGSEPIPNPSIYVQNLGRSYQVIFNSHIRKGGQHTLSLELDSSSFGTVISPPYMFEQQVLPIGIQFSDLAKDVTITLDANGVYSTVELPIEVQYSFPDGYPRRLVSSSLLVNGENLVQNDQIPFGSFVLNLAQFDNNQDITIQVEVLDELGLTGSSPKMSVQIKFIQQKSIVEQAWEQNKWFIGSVAGLILVIFCLFLISQYRNRMRFSAIANKGDETTAHLPHNKKPLAVLTQLGPDNLPLAEKPHIIFNELTLIGNDPSLCNITLEDPSVEPLHSQLRFKEDGNFYLTNIFSSAVTRVNHLIIPLQGIKLRQGDLITLGQLNFRFNSNR